MKIVITRHGETTANKKELASGGDNNSALSELGKEQAKKLALRLEKEEIDIIFCSDLTRCKQTIAPFLEKNKKEIYYDKRLREQYYGIFEGKKTKKMIEWFQNNPGKEPEGWESKDKLKERINDFLTKTLHKFKDKNILIVTHGRTKRAILEILLEKAKEHHEKIKEKSPNTALTIIEISNNNNPIVHLLNSDNHLKNNS